MRGPRPLSADALAWRCPAEVFAPSAAPGDAQPPGGQTGALDALAFALAVAERGYNVYAMGPDALDKRALVLARLRAAAADAKAPVDLCYVARFKNPRRPRLPHLPAGRRAALRADLVGLVRDLKPALAAAFENEEFRTHRELLEQGLKDRQAAAIGEVEEAAKARSIALVRTPMGFAFMPTRDGEVVPPDEFSRRPEEHRRRVREAIAELERRLQAAVRQFPSLAERGPRAGADPRPRHGVLRAAAPLRAEEGEHSHPLLRRYLINLLGDARGPPARRSSSRTIPPTTASSAASSTARRMGPC